MLTDTELRLAASGLDSSREIFGATLLTCHFYNPYSDNYWLFHRSGDFRFGEVVNGPLTLQDQMDRFNCRKDKEDDNSTYHFDLKSEDAQPLRSPLLGGPCFATRERVEYAVRIRIVPKGEDYQRLYQPHVVVFLNYCTGQQPPKPGDEFSQKVRRFHERWGRILLELASQPSLTEDEGWRLRSVVMHLRKEVGKISGKYIVDTSEKPAKDLYDVIARQAVALVAPPPSSNDPDSADQGGHVRSLLAVINEKAVIEKVSVGGVAKDILPETLAGGVVEHVARNGRIFFIEDVPKYINELAKRDGDLMLPQFRRLLFEHEITHCSLVCPLVVQNKIVGVLALESDQRERIKDSHISLLFQYGTAAGLAVREFNLWRDLRTAITHQHKLRDAENDETILTITAEMAHHDIGHDARVWDFRGQRWYPQPNDEEEKTKVGQPRPNEYSGEEGFSRWVCMHRKPIALANLQPDNKNGPPFIAHVGEMDDENIFRGWREATKADKIPKTLSQFIAAEAKSDPPIRTDMAFPILSNNPVDINNVRGALWVKSHRDFHSFLDDDAWCLSLLCRNASEELARILRLAGSDRNLSILEYRFGRQRAPAIQMLIKQNPNALVATSVDVLLFTADIRNSSEIGRNADPMEYGKLMGEFHNLARKAVTDFDGVLDKHVGDAVLGIFNVYGKFIDVKPPSEVSDSRSKAVKCAFRVAEHFDGMIRSNAGKLDTAIPEPLPLRIAVCEGKSFVGSPPLPEVVLIGTEFTAYGEPANRINRVSKNLSLEKLTAIFKDKSKNIFWPPLSLGVKRKPLAIIDRKKLTAMLRQKPHMLVFDKCFEFTPELHSLYTGGGGPVEINFEKAIYIVCLVKCQQVVGMTD